MRVLVSAYPFLNRPAGCDGIEFVYHPWNRKPRPEEILDEVLRGGYHGLIAGTEKLLNTIADGARELRVISRVGSGFDNLDVEYFAGRGIVTTYTPFGPVDAVAEMTVGLIVAGLRGFRIHDLRIRSGEWKRDFGRRVRDCRVGIVGFGRIGRRVAALLAPFRCGILLHDTAPDEATAHAMGWRFVPKETLLTEADVVTLHVPLKGDTRGWLSRAELAACKPTVLVVNAARGGIVDEAAMVDFLTAHPEAYYACDVFEREPYSGDLRACANTLVLPHIGASTVGSRRAMEEGATENCIQVLRGEACPNVVSRNL